MLPQTKILVMALPSTPETIHILNRERIALLPADAYVINVGRGTALDQAALAEALNTGKLAGAALDVMDPEPLPREDPPVGRPEPDPHPPCLRQHDPWGTPATGTWSCSART